MNLPIDPDKISQLLSELEQEAAEDLPATNLIRSKRPFMPRAPSIASGC